MTKFDEIKKIIKKINKFSLDDLQFIMEFKYNDKALKDI